MKYLAHISEDKKREESVFEHAQKVAEKAKSFAEIFDAADWGYCCGMMHDIGKYSKEFYERLHGGAPVDHATAGAKELSKENGLYLLAAYCVAGHHAGLPDTGTTSDPAGSASMQGRLKKKLADYMDYKKEISIPQLTMPSIQVIDGYSVSFFIRMIYSCLVDADFLETENFMTNHVTNREPGTITIELVEQVMNYVAEWLTNENKETVNGRRTEILRECLKIGNIKHENGCSNIFSLTVPTGGGKTISSLTFALQHAHVNKKDRIIYVIPYTSIIEQNAEIFRKILGEDQVLEHHSNVQYEDNFEFQKMQLASENWDKPVIVTTNVQFFESLFSNRSSRCRKLHNLANSVIIFDEVQMLPTSYLKPCIRAIKELAINYKSTIVLCTATQPSIQNFFAKDLRIQELCPNMKEQFEFFRRVQVNNIGMISEEELIQKLKKENQALCILNNRKQVQKVYQLLKKEGYYHLSTFMYPEHRKKILARIKERLNDNKKCIVISTCLVEAGVDLDFQHVYRELAGVDSVVQAAGRCNREGKRPLDESSVFVFQLKERNFIPAEVKQSIEVAKIVSESFEDITSLEAIESYFVQLHYIKGAELDQKGILNQLEKQASNGKYPFASVAKEFKMIENQEKAIIIAKENKAKELVRRLFCGERSKQLMREIGHYSVQVYEKDFELLRAAGYLEQLDQEIALLRNLEKYSEDMGIVMDTKFGEAVFL